MKTVTPSSSIPLTPYELGAKDMKEYIVKIIEESKCDKETEMHTCNVILKKIRNEVK